MFWRKRKPQPPRDPVNNKIRVGLILELDRASRDEHGDREWFDQLLIMDERMVADEANGPWDSASADARSR